MSMNVKLVQTTAISLLPVITLMVALNVNAILDMREMESTAQVSFRLLRSVVIDC